MSTQPEALRLADALDSWYNRTAIDDIDDAATELRRLHAVNQELLEACKKALYALKGREHDQFLRDAIAKATGEQK